MISYESEIKKGTFEILISDPDKLEVTNININEKGVKEIIASESGQFRIILKADEAKGKFLFEW